MEGKIYEPLLAKRIKQHLARNGGLSGNQDGFTQGKSTIEAMQRIVQLIRMTKGRSRRTKEKCVVVALDAIKEEMEHLKIPFCLKGIIADYFTNGHIIGSYEQKIGISCGVPQGSIMGPLIYETSFMTAYCEWTWSEINNGR